MVRIERTQTGVRLETRLLKVLKALAEYLDVSLGELLEAVVLHAFEGKLVFGAPTLQTIEQLRQIYRLELRAEDAHHLQEMD
jgi:hypothetical protein